MSDKERVVSELIASSSNAIDNTKGEKKKILIEEVGSSKERGAESSTSTVPPKVIPVEDDGPSLMEMMMQAQKEAKQKDDKVKATARAKEEKKGLGGGFKKGFLGGGSSKSKQKKVTKKVEKKDEIPTITSKQSSSSKGNSGIVLDDVQKALREEEERNPLLQQLKSGEWASEDLMTQLQSNPVLLRGMQNPKCQAALQLLQTDPQAAKKKYEHDPEVGAFMQAFSAIMADHFTRLGEAQQQQTEQQSVPIPEGQTEIGPLHAEAISRQQEKSKKGEGIISEVNKEEDARVQEIVQDEELRNLLMDPQLQCILQECGDPIKFQKHMRDPVTAYKIKKLYDAGLVGTAK